MKIEIMGIEGVKMKFYEFDKNGYYAIVCANSLYEAVSYYSYVSDYIVYNTKEPTEIKKEVAIQYLISRTQPYANAPEKEVTREIERVMRRKLPFALIGEEDLEKK